MDPRIVSFLNLHRTAVLSVTLVDGSLHAATCHYAHADEPFTIFIVTEASTRKVSSIREGQVIKAAITIGFSEEEWIELQMSGSAKMVKEGIEFDKGKLTFEEKLGGELKPGRVIVVFTPDWWRYSEFRRNPPVILEG